MLAVKFYNLRALIHRPFLSCSTAAATESLSSFPSSELEQWRVRQSKRTCVDAAQQTARLLHNLHDKKSLIFGFPWWQMISCLICASSILLVARILLDHDQRAGEESLDWASVEEDADLCLRVFEVLSTNSKAARLARDMMQGLKETRSRSTLGSGEQPSMAHFPLTSDPPADSLSRRDLALYGFDPDSLHNDFVGYLQGVSEPVMWSAQFVDAAYNPFLGYSSATF